MALDHLELHAREPRPRGHGRVVVAGVVGACVLGAGLGFWARPALPEDKTPPPLEPVAAEATRAALQIVIEDEPAPLGEPLEVLPPGLRDHNLAPFGPRPETVVAARPAAGLVKVDAPVAAAASLPVIRLESPPKVEAPRAMPPREAPRPAAATRQARAEADPVKKAERAEAKDKSAKAKTRETKARVEKREAKVSVEKIEKRVAEKAKPQRKTLAKAVKAAPKTIEAKAKSAVRKVRKTELAEAKPKAKKPPATKVRTDKAQVAKAKPTPAKVKAKTETARAQAQKKPTPRGEGPMRVARAPGRCDRPDPGEALVCADGRLGVRDRQLQQAYRDAEAAGVPPSALRRQQARWLQARAAAAREAPWAVEDVYVARIAELNDLTQGARQN